MTVAVMEKNQAVDMSEVYALANKLLATPKGEALSKQYLAEIEEDADDLTLTASVISFIYDRGYSDSGPLAYFLMLYELTKYVREKCQEIPEEERANLLEYVEEGEEELRCIVKSKSELESILSQVCQ